MPVPLPSSLRRLSLSSSNVVLEAKAATKSALRAGKYRVKETSRDLWSKTKKETKGAKKKSRELVGISSELLSSLSQRVTEKLKSSTSSSTPSSSSTFKLKRKGSTSIDQSMNEFKYLAAEPVAVTFFLYLSVSSLCLFFYSVAVSLSFEMISLHITNFKERNPFILLPC